MRLAKPSGKRILFLLSFVTLVMLVFFAGRYFLLSKIRQTLREKIDDLQEKGIILTFDRAEVNPWSGDISIHQLQVKLMHPIDTTRLQVSVEFPELVIQGINIIPFLTDKNISINHIGIDKPVITYRPGATFARPETREKFFENIYIKDIRVNGASMHLKDSVKEDTVATIRSDLMIQHLGLQRMADSLAWRQSAVAISNFSFQLPHEFYSFSVKDIRLDLQKKNFEIDSIKITPALGRRAFMRKYGREIDYFKGNVPYLKVSGLMVSSDDRVRVKINCATMTVKLAVFRDKRYPFIKDRHTQLPSEFLQKLPFLLTVDTLLLKDSFVSYEEFPAEGDSSGAVYFDKLYATAYAVTNENDSASHTKMQARAKFMGTGDLLVNFTFPSDTTRPYTVAGWLRDFPMTKLNDMLGPAAKARIESGIMTNLEFHFRYNSTRSDGTLELNYKDLKMSSLRKDKKERVRVSLVKTLLLNLFIIKKDMDEDVKDDKKTGTIQFYRNTKRSIFNYWWKSVFSGIKSAYNLDRFENKNGNDHKKHSDKKDRKDDHKKEVRRFKRKDPS
jgi:hypothetical protein